MSTGNRGVLRCLWLAILLPALAPGSGVAQFNLETVSRPNPGSSQEVRTIPRTCRLPEEGLARIRTGLGSLFIRSVGDTDLAALELDRYRQASADAGAGFHLDDQSLHSLPVLRDLRIVIPGIDCVEKVEAGMLRALSLEHPELIDPLFDLYLRAYAVELSSPPPFRHWLAARTEDRLVWLIDLYRELHSGDAAEGVALMRLALADEMQRSLFLRSLVDARALFRRIPPQGEIGFAARYSAAFLGERLGDYRAAAHEFGRLAKGRPDDLELALRQAINRARDKDRRFAVKRLERLVAREVGAGWLRVVAYQELARLRAEGRGDPVATLEEALEIFPAEPQLKLQLASYLGERWSEIDRLVEELDAVPGGEVEPLPRVLYDSLRRTELDAQRQVLARRAAQGRPALTAAVEALLAR